MQDGNIINNITNDSVQSWAYFITFESPCKAEKYIFVSQI